MSNNPQPVSFQIPGLLAEEFTLRHRGFKVEDGTIHMTTKDLDSFRCWLEVLVSSPTYGAMARPVLNQVRFAVLAQIVREQA